MLRPEYTTRFKKDLKMMQKRNMEMQLLKEVICKLCCEQELPEKNKDHFLSGNWGGHRGMPHPAGLVANLSNWSWYDYF